MRKHKGSALTAAASTVILVLAATIGVSGKANPDRPSVPVGLDTSYFNGTWTCETTFVGVEWVDGVEHRKGHVTCTTESTDPRVVGTEEMDTIVYGTRWTDSPWTADGVLTTAQGVWRGSGHGMGGMSGASGLGMAGFPFGFGEMTYIGEGAYDGLVMRYFLAGHAGNQAVSGWVTPAE